MSAGFSVFGQFLLWINPLAISYLTKENKRLIEEALLSALLIRILKKGGSNKSIGLLCFQNEKCVEEGF